MEGRTVIDVVLELSSVLWLVAGGWIYMYLNLGLQTRGGCLCYLVRAVFVPAKSSNR